MKFTISMFRLGVNRFALTGAAALMTATPNVRAQHAFTTISVPGGQPTEAYGISGNDIVGTYFSDGIIYGFLYNGSSYTTLAVPGAVQTQALGVFGNDVAGEYEGSGSPQGFLYNGSTYLTLSVPGAQSTCATCISGNTVLGFYNGNQGFLYNISDNTYTTLNVPGMPYGVSGNNIVGYSFSNGEPYGFLYNGSGYTTLDVPGSLYTEAYGISGNNIVGYYEGGSGGFNGFLDDGNTYATLDVPGAVESWAFGISGNEIVGAYTTPDGDQYGFLATPVPEPAPILLLAAGGLALTGRRYHARRRDSSLFNRRQNV